MRPSPGARVLQLSFPATAPKLSSSESASGTTGHHHRSAQDQRVQRSGYQNLLGWSSAASAAADAASTVLSEVWGVKTRGSGGPEGKKDRQTGLFLFSSPSAPSDK